MNALDLTLAQVLGNAAGSADPGTAAIPLLRQRVGPGAMVSFHSFQGSVPFSRDLIGGLIEPICGILGADLALPLQFRTGDTILLDQNPRYRLNPTAESCFVIAEGTGLLVRYVRRNRGTLESAREPGVAGAAGWHPVSGAERGILDTVRARVVWIGRKMESPHAGSPGPTGKVD